MKKKKAFLLGTVIFVVVAAIAIVVAFVLLSRNSSNVIDSNSTVNSSTDNASKEAQPVSASTSQAEQLSCEDICKQIKNGDFSNVQADGKGVLDILSGSCYEIVGEREWVYADISKDGIDELILQETDSRTYKRINAAFIYIKDKMKCILDDFVDGTEFYFLGKDNNLIYYDQYLGTYQSVSYQSVEIDNTGDEKLAFGLEIYNIYDVQEIETDLKWWQENHPDMVNGGLFFKKYVADSEGNLIENTLTKEEFCAEYKSLTGEEYQNYNDLIN